MRCAFAECGCREFAVKLTRRSFLTGSAALATPWAFPPASRAAEPTVLRVVKRDLEVSKRDVSVFGILQPGGVPGLVTDVSAPFRVRLENHAGEETLVHWHGLTPPAEQDGVPNLSQPLLAPGARYDY